MIANGCATSTGIVSIFTRPYSKNVIGLSWPILSFFHRVHAFTSIDWIAGGLFGASMEANKIKKEREMLARRWNQGRGKLSATNTLCIERIRNELGDRGKFKYSVVIVVAREFTGSTKGNYVCNYERNRTRPNHSKYLSFGLDLPRSYLIHCTEWAISDLSESIFHVDSITIDRETLISRGVLLYFSKRGRVLVWDFMA